MMGGEVSITARGKVIGQESMDFSISQDDGRIKARAPERRQSVPRILRLKARELNFIVSGGRFSVANRGGVT